MVSNKFGIPEEELKRIRARDKNCVYCHKVMIYPYNKGDRSNSATIEHLREVGPFYWSEGLKAEDLVICCGSCNPSRGKKKLADWFKTQHCIDNKINENLVTEPVKNTYVHWEAKFKLEYRIFMSSKL